MFLNDRDEKPNLIRTIRDVVEIVAIILAGAWAFYTFIYVNSIVPSFEQPKVVLTAQLTKQAVHDGLVAVRMQSTLKNVGTVHAHFLGIVWYVDGQRITPLARPASPTERAGGIALSAYYRSAVAVAVFASGFITHLGSAANGIDLDIEPGDESAEDWTFYVPEGKFDRLSAYIEAKYTRYDSQTIPTVLQWSHSGLPRLVSSSVEGRVFQVAAYFAQLDLHERTIPGT
jgi:hypothetical protein